MKENTTKVVCKLCGHVMDITDNEMRKKILENDGFIPCEECGSRATKWKIPKLLRKACVSILLCAVSLFGGCKSQEDDSSVRPTNTISVVVVGMETSQLAGACPGAAYDAQRMSSLLSQYSTNVRLYLNENAKKETVRQAMSEAVSADLFIFYYSGHGGQQRFWDTGSDEEDGMDEYLCLYDTYMRDNELWSIISKSKGRVMCIFDCCHSGTMYRNPQKPITFSACRPLSATHHVSGGLNLLVWSGCPDNTYSYGSKTGGQFTNALLRHYSPNKTYDYLWNEIECDSTLKKYEEVQRTIMGSGFDARLIFR